MDLISIIVPVYNVEKYIHRCIDSILAQSYVNFELILVDDGSPDNCGAICDNYAKTDNRIIVLHQTNAGLSAARNTGISIAKGDYFLFVDSDDVIHPDCLKILTTSIQESGAEVALGCFSRFNSSLISADKFSLWDGTYLTRTAEETLHRFFDDNTNLPSLVSACGKLWSQKLFSDIRFPVGRLFEDEFITYKLYHQANSVVFVDTTLYYYFFNTTGITQNLTLEKRFDEYDAQWERVQYFSQKNLHELLKKACMLFLKTAQWDLIECRKNSENISCTKKQRFEKQYYHVFKLTKKMKLLNFLKHYDYYILATPRLSFFLRVKRQILLLIERSNHD